MITEKPDVIPEEAQDYTIWTHDPDPYDLSASMGITGKFNNLKFKKTIQKIKNIAKKFKVPLGIHIVEPNYKNLKKFINSGYQFIPYCTDTALINSAIKNSFKK